MKAFAANPDGVWVKNGSRGLAGRQGPPEGVRSCGERATAPFQHICVFRFLSFFCSIRFSKAREMRRIDLFEATMQG